MVRKSGILLPMTALPSKYGIGDFGPEATRFAEFLSNAGQTVWQVLPSTAVDGGCGNSPYSPPSAFAGNPLLISPDMMVASGLLDADDIKNTPAFSVSSVDYDAVRAFKGDLLRRAWSNFKAVGRWTEYDEFWSVNRYWLESYSFFAAIKELQDGKSWYEWPDDLKFRTGSALHKIWEESSDEVSFHRFVQFVFYSQFAEFRDCLDQFNIELVGDMPIYMTLDSADVWANPHLFELDDKLKPTSVAGVPPDYFSETGQLWGNPLYRWDVMERDGFQWWISRLHHLLAWFDKIRIDHFRGLIGYWSVPAGEETAEKGYWRNAPHEQFFARISREFPARPFWAENLGVLSSGIEAARKGMGLPGMLVLHFAFGNPSDNPYAPHNHTHDSVVYVGTHDNNTSIGWFMEDKTPEELQNLILYLGKEITSDSICDDMIRVALSSVAETAIIQMQDYLHLGSSARMNTPSTPSGNWAWRMTPSQATGELASYIQKLTKLYGRLPPEPVKV
ncbi:4-alpha-glucanotransferase [Synergistales bacterium]|nr:4-alpha-glucanotransferase [Synergistales bacterium]